MTKTITGTFDDDRSDETRLVTPAPRPSGTPASTSGWLASSGSIDHGRFEPGTLLGNRYRIIGRLGKGGMGEVYRADDLKLGQPVALKFLPPEVDRDPARLTQLHSEVRMARQVSHPNVCRVYDIDEVDGHTFLSMEYVDGEDLASLLRRIGRFPEERGLELARQICAGLAAAHEREVVHRDFKPANVMVDGTGRVRITDFGLAGTGGEVLRAGTPAYMAPEQLAGGEVDARSDIYALGLVLYELFTGKRALEGATLAELIRRREQAEITPPSAIVRDLSPEIDRAIMRCLAPDAAARPVSALAVAAALPGGDPLAAALAAGETPSPQMVAAAGEEGTLGRGAGFTLLACVVAALLAGGLLADRTLLIARAGFHRSADVLEDRARELLRTIGYGAPAADTSRGAGLNTEYISWIAQNDGSRDRWNALTSGHVPLLHFWYRTSPRPLIPLSTSWRAGLNDPPHTVSGMTTVITDENGRLAEFIAVPPQRDTSTDRPQPVDWDTFFAAAGLDRTQFVDVPAEWTPRVYADARVAWEGPMPGRPAERLRVEAASYRDQAVSFQLIWPWTRPARMDAGDPTAVQRALSLAGALFILVLMTGAVALARHNLRSGRADRRGAGRIAIVLLGMWVAAWALLAEHSLSLDAELDLFFGAFAFALLNVGFTWLFYLGLEPFVRKYCPEILISWTRLLDGRLKDPRVGRDLLIGVATGALLAQMSTIYALTVPLLLDGPPPPPRTSYLHYLFETRFVISSILRVIPNALQTSMIGTFAFVVLLALSGRRRILAIAGAVALLTLVVLAESGSSQIVSTIIFALVIQAPVLFVFLRYGLLAIAALFVTLQVLSNVPLTVNPSHPHAYATALVVAVLLSIAGYAFHISGAGRGLLRRLLPAA